MRLIAESVSQGEMWLCVGKLGKKLRSPAEACAGTGKDELDSF